jgi:hypothetical protein
MFGPPLAADHREARSSAHGKGTLLKFRKTITATALSAVALGTALTLGLAEDGTPSPTPSPSTPKLNGTWQTDGYGTVLALKAGGLTEYQVTGIGCIKGASAGRTGPAAGPARFTAQDGEVYTIRPAKDPDRAELRSAGSPGDRNLRRLPALPASCTRQIPKDPRSTFDVFWQTFDENYPFFKAKGIDWDAARTRYRPQVHTRTTGKELFAVFRKMLAPLHDAHVSVRAGRTGFYAGIRPGTELPTPDLDRRAVSLIRKHDLKGARLQQFAQGRIGYADLPGGQGYLRLSGFSGYTRSGTYAAERRALDKALDTVLTPERTSKLRGLTIDLRINGGGSDLLGLRLASRLTDRPYTAYAKRVRNDPADPGGFTRPQRQTVRPASGRTRYTGPTAVLTSGSTFSAGETFTQALIERPGRTVRIGQPTQGVFSDVMDRELPNGWQVGLPNEEFLTRSGRTFDGPGIPPQVKEPVFTKEEFAGNRDSAFDRAADWLRAAKP